MILKCSHFKIAVIDTNREQQHKSNHRNFILRNAENLLHELTASRIRLPSWLKEEMTTETLNHIMLDF